MLIDLNKIRYDSEIKVRLSDECFEMFIQNVKDYFTILENEFNKSSPRISPLDALSIISMLVGFKDYFDSIPAWERLSLESLKVVHKGVSRGVFDKFSLFSGMTHVAFIIHNMSFKTPSIKPFLYDVNKILLNNLSVYLSSTSMEELMNTGTYEVITGLSGPLHYLLGFPENDEMVEMATKIVDLFIQRSKVKIVAGHKVTG